MRHRDVALGQLHQLCLWLNPAFVLRAFQSESAVKSDQLSRALNTQVFDGPGKDLLSDVPLFRDCTERFLKAGAKFIVQKCLKLL